MNYRTRGKDSQKDQALVERIGKELGMETDILVMKRGENTHGRRSGGVQFPSGFEEWARHTRYRFLRNLSEKAGAEAIALAHTADDQVETILMRVFEGAGISGLKGIPRESEDGIVRPILHVWKEDILEYLKEHKIPYRVDKSNLDTRFERNWIRHVLIPLLEKRYGRTVKKRIYILGERFRELDDFLETETGKWIRRNVKPGQPPGGGEKRKYEPGILDEYLAGFRVYASSKTSSSFLKTFKREMEIARNYSSSSLLNLLHRMSYIFIVASYLALNSFGQKRSL